jgi:hypothetical protein
MVLPALIALEAVSSSPTVAFEDAVRRLFTVSLLEAVINPVPVNAAACTVPENVPVDAVMPPVRVRSLVPVMLPGT